MNWRIMLRGLARHPVVSAVRGRRRRGPRPFEFSVAIYSGTSLFDLQPLRGVENPMLTRDDVTDRRAGFVADPFILRIGGRWHMFLEVWNRDLEKGEIGLVLSDDGVEWRYQKIVLAEPFHLAYPYVFQWDGGYYMIPESFQERSVRLYRAVEFPTQWSFVATLLTGEPYVDSSIVRFRGTWWLFTGVGAPPFHADSLLLHYADELTGPWQAHPASPIVRNDLHVARPGGRVLLSEHGVIRFAQDCSPRYGIRVRAFEATELTVDHYTERPLGHRPVLEPGSAKWNASGMHHIDAGLLDDGRWLAAVDGWCWLDGGNRASR